ncbi:MAG: malto-oligosyltrehalose synthase, partial [Terrimesophilobacter sp.]
WGATPDLDWHKLIFGTKTGVADGILRSEVNRLARLMPAIDGAADALIPIIAAFTVYRSYLPLGLGHLEAARIHARDELPELAQRIDEVAGVLATEGDPASIRFQQTSGMVMAKGVEDTAFYRFGSLTSLNEVGADPSEFAIGVHTFHDRQTRRQSALPNSMTTLSTHDTKRSEDVRATISALSERPELWSSFAARVHAVADLGDPVIENLLWQAIVGAWPASRERLHGYAEKAARESGISTNWIDPNAVFESRLHAAVDSAFDNEEVSAAIGDVVEAIGPASSSNSLSAKLLQLASPGIPDVYQGSELWDRSLVDPDNRRSVDFGERRRLLDRIDSGWLPPIDASGAAKLLLVSRTLRLRRDHPERFTRYRGLTVFGAKADHAIAFDRGGVIAVATRLSHGLEQSGGWQDTTIEPGGRELVDVLTGRVFGAGSVRLADLLERYPVALLTKNRGVRE